MNTEKFLEWIVDKTSESNLPYHKGLRNGIKLALAIYRKQKQLTLEMPGWTSPSEELPPNYVKVLVAMKRSNEIEYKVDYVIPCATGISETGRIFASEVGGNTIVGWQYFQVYDEEQEKRCRTENVLTLTYEEV